jgi:hypothetical protein
MPARIVDAYDQEGDVVCSYPIILNHMNMPVTDQDFIEEAKACHQEDGLSVSLVERWVVREPRLGE